ncbi:MAG: hydrogenase maturation peptidase HycI [Candidatus Odinarchaeia archaeon]
MELEEKLIKELKDATRVVIMGVGSEIRNDDAIGLRLIRSLKNEVPKEVIAIECGPVPESFTGVVRSLKPSHVIIIDAAEMGKKPGSIEIINKHNIIGISFSTHQLPLSVLIEYLEDTIDAKIVLIGVQPLNVSLGEELSEVAEQAISTLKNTLINVLNTVFGTH